MILWKVESVKVHHLVRLCGQKNFLCFTKFHQEWDFLRKKVTRYIFQPIRALDLSPISRRKFHILVNHLFTTKRDSCAISPWLSRFFPDDAIEGFQKYSDHTLTNHGGALLQTYIDVTSQVCRHLCVRLHSDACCSVLYDRTTRSCFITPADKDSSGVQFTPRLYNDNYQRRKCAGQYPTHFRSLCNCVPGELMILLY